MEVACQSLPIPVEWAERDVIRPVVIPHPVQARQETATRVASSVRAISSPTDWCFTCGGSLSQEVIDIVVILNVLREMSAGRRGAQTTVWLPLEKRGDPLRRAF